MENLKVKDLFNESNPKVAAERHEEYLGELSKSLSSPRQFVNGELGQDPTKQLETLAANKSLTPDALASLQTALTAQRGAVGDINKEITLTNPLSTSFAAFDLEAPAKMYKKPVFHLIHNSHPYPEIIDAEKNQHIIYNSLWLKELLNYNFSNFILTPPVDYNYYDLGNEPEKSEYITLINLNENKGGKIFAEIARAMPHKSFLGVYGSYDEQH